MDIAGWAQCLQRPRALTKFHSLSTVLETGGSRDAWSVLPGEAKFILGDEEAATASSKALTSH